MQRAPFKPQDATHVEALREFELMVAYCNWQQRIIQPIPRQVHLSKALRSHAKFSDYQSIIESIADDLQNGVSITPHCTTRLRWGIAKPTKPKKLQRREDFDVLLGNWGIHHLHLARHAHPHLEVFYARTTDLLFVALSKTDAYFLDLGGHRWERQRLVEILLEEYPESGLINKLEGLTALSPAYQWTGKEQIGLGNAGYAEHISINGKIYVAGGNAISRAGTSVWATHQAGHILQSVYNFADSWNSNPNAIEQRLLDRGLSIKQPLSWKFLMWGLKPAMIDDVNKIIHWI